MQSVNFPSSNFGNTVLLGQTQFNRSNQANPFASAALHSQDTIHFAGRTDNTKNDKNKKKNNGDDDNTKRNHFIKGAIGLTLGLAGAAAVGVTFLPTPLLVLGPVALAAIGIPAAGAAAWGAYELYQGFTHGKDDNSNKKADNNSGDDQGSKPPEDDSK